jgi:hypothetical protein
MVPRVNLLGVAVFSRPSIRLPKSIDDLSLQIDFRSGHNDKDITSLLRYEVSDIDDVYGFLDRSKFDETITQILRRSESMFLWADLLMCYLRSPSLTNFDRKDAIRNLSRLEGFDSLFTAILEHLARPLPARAKDRIATMFRWVALSVRALTPTELASAAAIPLDRAATVDDVIPNLEKSIGVVSGALLEIGIRGTVRFVHQSVREFITDITYEPSSGSQFLLRPLLANLSISHTCLSYLYYSIPWEPLSGSSQIVPSPDYQRKRFPVLEYIAEYWPYHVSTLCSTYRSPTIDTAAQQQLRSFLDIFTRFIKNKSLMSLWIEASWMFGTPPSLQDLPEVFMQLCEETSLSDLFTQSFVEGGQYLEDISDDLKALNASWWDVLQYSPNEIWAPSITIFGSPRFWKQISGAAFRPIAQTREPLERSIVVLSQLCETGDKLGLLRVRIPP